MTNWVSRFSDEIALDVPAFRHERVKSSAKSGLPVGNWFYLELTPVSAHPENVAQVLSDLLRSYPLFEIGRNGCVLPEKTETPRECILSDRDRGSIRFVKPTTFKIAMWEGSSNKEQNRFLNYPVFFTLQPELNHVTFPLHPHLNPVTVCQNIFLPQSICYEINFEEMGTNKYNIAMNAYIRVCIWLFRHQVWVRQRGDRLNRWPGTEVQTTMNQINNCKQQSLFFGKSAAATQEKIKSLFQII